MDASHTARDIGAANPGRPPNKPRIAVVFERFGPYHLARLNAAGQLLDVWGVESCAEDDTYAWDKVDGAASFTRVTLTGQQTPGRRWKMELRHQMWRKLDEIQPQAVAVPGWSSADAITAWIWCVRTRTPAIVMSDSTAWDEIRVAWKEMVKSRLVMLGSAALVAGAPHVDYLVQLGFPRDKIFPGYDTVDNAHFSSHADFIRGQAAENRRLHGLPEHFFLASARFIGKKNLPALLHAFALYRQRSARESQPIQCDLVLLGDGVLKPALTALIADLGLGSCVHLAGFKQYPELPVYFGLARAFVHASTTEQWGLVVNEAMASGLPVLVSDRCGCASDLVVDNRNGFTFAPDDVEALADLMFKLARPEFPIAQFGAESRRIIADWGPSRFATGLRDAFEAAIKFPPRHASLLDRALLRLLLRR